nr:heparan-alpha-glucosaminide N-acetyltransferase domain-containing protein [Bacillus tuaregi]
MKSTPISSQERILTIDIIRGFALLGIFLVNMPAFHSPALMVSAPEYNGMDYWLDLLFQMFVQTKFYTIFSFLFGLGFYIFMSRAEQKGLRINRLFSRRLFALLLFGALHLVLLWYGDILHTYAIAGFLLLLFYKRKPKTLLIWAFSLLIAFHALTDFRKKSPILKNCEGR